MIGYPIFCYATYGCNFFCRDLWILLIIFRIVSVVSVGVSVLTEGVSVVTVVVSVVTVDVSVVSLMFLSCLKQVYEVYTKKGHQHFGDLFLVSFIFSLFSEFLFEPLVECHVGTDFLLVLRLGKCQYIAR